MNIGKKAALLAEAASTMVIIGTGGASPHWCWKFPGQQL